MIKQQALNLLHLPFSRPGGAAWTSVLLLACAVAACRPEDEGQAHRRTWVGPHGEAVLEWVGSGGFAEWNCGGAYIYGTSAKPKVFEVWKWNGNKLVRLRERALRNEWLATCLQDDRYICGSLPGNEPHGLHVKSIVTGAMIWNWAYLPGWYCDVIGLSRDGARVALCLAEGTGERGPPGSDYNRPRIRLGLMESDATEIDWVTTLTGDGAGACGNVRSVIPSDDGTYIAVASWDHKLAMVDVSAGALLWAKQPRGEVNLGYAAFSPDSDVVYTGGTMAVVYGMDVRTGKVLSSWVAGRSGQPEYGHRIACVAVSPDGRWVAAGTGPEGRVWVFRERDGKHVATLDHGGSTVQLVHFSPDSSALASFVPGTLKIWKVSRWDKNPPAKPTTRPATSGPPDGSAPTELVPASAPSGGR